MNYVALHVHTDASPDGAGTVQSLVQRAVELKMPALAMTDHGTLANAVAFWSACSEAEIKPILGMEAYLSYKGKRHHLTLLTLNEVGFNNLVHLDSWSHAENYSGGYPLMTLDEIYRNREGLYCLSGCPASALYEGGVDDAFAYGWDLMDVMGKDSVAAEAMFVGTHDAWTRPSLLADNGYPFVITNDSHYPCRNQFHAHQTVCLSRHGYTYNSKELWLKSGSEIAEQAMGRISPSKLLEGMNLTLEIANRVESWDMRSAPSLPHIENVVELLRNALVEAHRKDVALKGGARERGTRLQYEWRILREKNFLDYIYILWDIVSWAKEPGRNIRVGPGRGSGGGSYTLYLLGITSIDPIEYGLLFERFINPSRADYPDVDVDFESERRSEVIEYAQNRWGTIPIATYSCYSHKSAIHDIARTLKIPKTLEEPAADSERDSEAFEKFMNYTENALSSYETMLGQIRHRGKHAAGVIIPNRPVPIERAPDGNLVAAWAEGMNTKDLSKVGIVKYDILGLTALSQLKRMEELADESFPVENYSDPAVYSLFCNGDVAGIFQWSGSDGIRELTRSVAPRNFYDLTTCNALYRPGALDAGTAELYPEYMKSPRKLHPRIDPHLEKTYGVLCYQEQVMAVVAEMMGGDLAQADIVRRLISKAAHGDPKWEKEIEKLRVDFWQAAVNRQGFPIGVVDQLWGEIYTHSGYSYNLSHASAYTMISYQMAWYKVYHRPAFLAAVLQYDKANAQTYILDAIEAGLIIRMPDVNFSTNNYEIKDDKIYLPLSDISFLGDKAAEFLIKERTANGCFDTFEDFSKRIPKKTCNNRAKSMMYRIGAFASVTGDPADAIDKFSDLPLTDIYQTQLEILGYVVPTAKLYTKLKELESAPTKKDHTRFAGFIRKIEKKKSTYGEYSVFTLSPSGSFWMREPSSKMKVGVFVSGTKNRFGSSKDAKAYRLVTED